MRWLTVDQACPAAWACACFMRALPPPAHVTLTRRMPQRPSATFPNPTLKLRQPPTTPTQVIQDSVYFLAQTRARLSIPDETPAIAFGGSYGGELVAWLRAGEPASFAAAIASR